MNRAFKVIQGRANYWCQQKSRTGCCRNVQRCWCRCQQLHSHLTPPPSRSTCTSYFQKLESLAYISVAHSMGLSSFTFVQCAPKDASFLQQSAYWPFKVIQGRRFWYQSKERMRLPISRSLWLWSYLAPFLRYSDLLAKNCLFFLPLSHSAPLLPMFPLEFRAELNHEETRVTGLSYSEDPMIVAWVILTQCQRVTDGRTDRRTDLLLLCWCAVKITAWLLTFGSNKLLQRTWK